MSCNDLIRLFNEGVHLIGKRGRMERSDEYLLELALGGDGACFGELIGRWQQKIYGFIYRYVGSREDARDLTQDTFTKAYQNLEHLSDPRRFSSWLYKIALNECRMRFRRSRNVQPVPLQDSVQAKWAEVEGSTPEKVLVAKETTRVLREAFWDLPEEQRAVIVMKEYEGLKFREIATMLGVPLSTVKSRMYLGLKTLRKLMEQKL